MAAILANEQRQLEASRRYRHGFWYGKRSVNATVKITRYVPYRRSGTRSYTLYALKLEGDHYYVGMTAYRDPVRRLKEHLTGDRGALWTSLHKPLSIIETRCVGEMSQGECAQLENQMTLEYMDKHGIDYVRGGDMCQLATNKVSKIYRRHMKRRLRHNLTKAF